MRLRALIADDEPLARERLRFLLAGDEEIEIARECRNGKEVVAALKESAIDVVLLDIVERLGPSHMPITVFVTAHNHYAVKAFDVCALDYLTKPVEPERLKAT